MWCRTTGATRNLVVELLSSRWELPGLIRRSSPVGCRLTPSSWPGSTVLGPSGPRPYRPKCGLSPLTPWPRCGRVALVVFEQTRAILEALVKATPSVTDYRNELAITLLGLGRARRLAGDHAAAVADLRRAVALRE